MRDIDIRSSLRSKLPFIHNSNSNIRIIEELGLCQGTVRVDIAVIDGALHGYEIKSDQDTLERLPLQKQIYSQVLDTVVLVFSGRNVDKVTSQVPQWWGIWQAVEHDEQVEFEVIRNPELNPDVEPNSLVQCLWRDEALSILKERGLAQGLERKPRAILWQKLTETIPLTDLKVLVRNQLHIRENWRSDSPQA